MRCVAPCPTFIGWNAIVGGPGRANGGQFGAMEIQRASVVATTQLDLRGDQPTTIGKSKSKANVGNEHAIFQTEPNEQCSGLE
jgi:hypothetical protein